MKKTKLQRRLTAVFAVILCCVLFQATVFGGETETTTAAVSETEKAVSAETVKIRTADQLTAILSETDAEATAQKHYVLAEDLKLDTSKLEAAQKNGQPKRQFAGILDGNDHTITVKHAEKAAQPLFGVLNGSEDHPAEISGLTLVYEGDVSGTTVAMQTGAAEISDLTITVKGDIFFYGKGKKAYATGVFGTHLGKAPVKITSVSVDVKGSETEKDLSVGIFSEDDVKDGNVVIKKVKLQTAADSVKDDGKEPEEDAGPETTETASVETTQESKPAAETPADTKDEPQTAAREDTLRLAEGDWTVAFDLQEHGEAIADQTVSDGGLLTRPDDPTEEGYTFEGWYEKDSETAWDFENDPVTGNLTLYAKWTVQQCSITFDAENGQAAKTITAAYGTTAEDLLKEAGTPEKEATKQYTYTFEKWEPEVAAVTEDAIYKAVYQETLQKYELTFDPDNGTTAKTASFDYGLSAANLEKKVGIPKKTATARYSYTFDHWEPALAEVTEAASYKAVYKETVNQYKITFVNDDGTVLQEAAAYDYGTSPSEIRLPQTPTKSATAQYTYAFEGWTPTISAVTKDTVYTAKFKATVRTYQVIFNVNGHGTAPAAQTVQYNGMVSRPANLVAANYTFGGWYTDPACTSVYNFSTPVTGNLTLYARWIATATTRSTTAATRAATTVTTRNTTQPRTGDDTNLTLWIILLIAAAAAGGCAVVFGRRSKKKNG